MTLVWINDREVQRPPIPAPPPDRTQHISDAQYTCDGCGRMHLSVSTLQEQAGYYQTAEPAGWRQLSGFEWATRVDFCTYACEIDWLSRGEWRIAIRREIERQRKWVTEHPDAPRSGDAMTVELP